MANTYQATLDALLPDHTWRLDELTRGATYVDTGDTGGFDLNVTALGQEAPRGFPSVGIRGTPAVYGSWIGRSIGGGPYRESGPTDVGWLTGVFNVWITPMDMSSITYTLGVFWSNNPDVGLYFQIDTNGVLRFQCRFVGTRQNNASSTAAGVITEGRPHMLTVVQRGDGNGPQLYVNGAPIATTNSFNGTGITLDSWADDVINLGVSTDISTNGRGTSGGPGDIEPAIVAQPSIWINSTISDAQIAALYASANDNTNNFSDILEWIILGLHNETEVQDDLIRLLPVWGTPSPAGPGQQVDIGPGSPLGDGLQTSGIGSNVPGNMNAAEVSKVSIFESYQFLFDAADGAGNNTIFSIGSNTGWETSDTVGSVTVALKINGAGLDSKVFWAYGTSASNGIEVDLVSTIAPPTYRVRLIARESAVVTYTVFSDFLGGEFSIAPSDELLFVTIVQPGDGGGPQIYINGSNRTGLVTVSTNEDIWCADYTSSANLRIGGEQGSATVDPLEPNGVAMVMETRKVLTDTDALELYQAWLGIFPVPPAPPPAGFNETLTDIGNGDDPNGPGPDWYWRMNEESAPLQDSGIAQLRAIPIESDSILTGGDPTFEAGGPLPADVTAAAIYFDGLGDYFEMGVNGVSGELVDVGTGTVGGFLAANAQSDNIIYSQANDAGTAFWRLGLNSDNLVELVVQTSVGNSVTVVGNSQLFDRDFHLITATSDGTNILLYVDGKVQILTITEVGTGADGDWFDAFTATRGALGALASSTFPTNLTGRLSEVFIFDGDVLSAAQIATLFQAAINDGITGSTATAGVLRFE
ncbi:MAG: LamG-like jellyroll fold domain-containing protein, partial [Pseudohongiellaceae bacterium]